VESDTRFRAGRVVFSSGFRVASGASLVVEVDRGLDNQFDDEAARIPTRSAQRLRSGTTAPLNVLGQASRFTLLGLLGWREPRGLSSAQEPRNRPRREETPQFLFSQDEASGAVAAGIEFAGDSMRHSWITGAGRLRWFGIASERFAQWSRVSVRSGVARDVDGDGVVDLDPEDLMGESDLLLDLPEEAPQRERGPRRGVPDLSLWAFVDEESGRVALASSPEYRIRPLSVSEDAFAAGSVGFAARARVLVALWVRPGVGAWSTRVRDGTRADFDGAANRRTAIRTDEFVPIEPADGLPPETLGEGDVFVVFDEDSLRASLRVVRVGGREPQ
jgi:hypothetical protein